MKQLIKIKVLFLSIILSSCASNKQYHAIHDDENKNATFQYCGGELWGYTVDLMGPPAGENFWNKKFTPDRPHLAIFLHMQTLAAVDPQNTLTLWYVLRSRQDLSIQFKSKKISVQVGDNISETDLEFFAIQYGLSINQLYRSSEYDIKPNDLSANEWKVSKRNVWLFNQVTDEYKIVKTPETIRNEVDEENINIKFEPTKYDATYLQYATNIWPDKNGLKNAKIIITIPQFMINGKSVSSRRFQFDMNYDKVKKIRSKYGRCPSTAEIFRWNT